ncbi:MAG: AIPR family protein [Burkholderiales bacterium]|uniref:AIPR family protein n=1 Tax=Phenylobacterium sp. TaxID=1871053 RepID=UPI0025CE2901|nr:AIPR family protein [Phenylobacterium sp.]MCA3155473.1 AIPR family protein [Burkholderiales bacterium]MCA6243660.1 AIPR family protein [Phenylobacterium sp.]
MDRVTESLLSGFSAENGIQELEEFKRFEHLAAFSVIRRHFRRTFSTSDVVLGGGADTGIDAVAIILNNVLVTDVDGVREIATQNEYLEPVFIFVQAERSASFDSAKLGNFGFGVVDFFAKKPRLPRSIEVSNLAEITDVILGEFASILRPSRCYLYYITTGIWADDEHLVGRRDAVTSDVNQLSIFQTVETHCIGASGLHALYRKTKSPVSRQFLFDRRVEIPATDGVIQSSIGFLPFSEFKKLLTDEGGTEMLTSIFEDNIRDWQGYKTVNSGIRETLLSSDKAKFVLMNNGVTIITKGLTTVGHVHTVTDYQIVNGCQSSNVLFENRFDIDDTVQVPLRLIHTEDERIKDLITKATNSQTNIKPDQFASSKEFSRNLEMFFTTYPNEHRLYYERRAGQYDRGPESKLRVIDTPTILRSYASIFKEVPHSATRNYASIRDEIGDTIFANGDKQVAYYYAAYSWFLLEGFFRNKTIDSIFKSARYHLILTVHLMIDSLPPPPRNSKAIEIRSESALKVLWDADVAEDLFKRACALVREVTGGNMDRDHVRREAITDAIVAKFRPKQNPQAAI